MNFIPDYERLVQFGILMFLILEDSDDDYWRFFCLLEMFLIVKMVLLIFFGLLKMLLIIKILGISDNFAYFN